MANSYFSLTDSAGTSKKFVVLQSGFEPILEKNQNIQPTINGGLDVSMGAVYETHNYVVKVRETEPREGYGNISDLKYFFSLNNPLGIPSNVLVLTDHAGNDHEVFMLGQYLPNFLSVMIEGENAWAIVKCTFRFIP